MTPHVSQRKIALQVAEKVEAASTFRNATQQVAACDTPTAICLAIFFEKELTFLNTRREVKYNLIAGRKASCVRPNPATGLVNYDYNLLA